MGKKDGATIDLRKVSKVYGSGTGKAFGLRCLSIDVKKGDFVAVIGPSGCGKSTLLNLVGGIDTPTEGVVLIEGEDLSHLDDRALTRFRRERIGFVFQSFNLISTLTAMENVQLSLNLRGLKGEKARKEAIKYLDMVGIKKLKDRFPSELSGGQQQRVAIARALAKKPSILLADEPTGNIDSKSGKKVISVLHSSAKRTGMTTMMVTHDLSITPIADRIISLKDGMVVDDGYKEGKGS